MRKLLVLTGAAGIAAFVAQKLRQREPAWHSAPEAPEPSETGAAPAPDDTAGAGPDEALADAVEEPHEVTTPDAPLEEHDIPADPS